MEPKELKTAGELEAMIVAQLNDPRVKVSVAPGRASGWQATASSWAGTNTVAIRQVQQIAERLRAEYDLKIEPPNIELIK